MLSSSTGVRPVVKAGGATRSACKAKIKAVPAKGPCQACGKAPRRLYGRGLCRRCHIKPAVRRLFQTLSPWAVRQRGARRPPRSKCPACEERPPGLDGRRGLCRSCWDDPVIRARYEALAGVGEAAPLAPRDGVTCPRSATLPGTTARVDVMVERRRLGQPLWNVLDAEECLA